ncbi:hypothetical protein, partial [Sphingomonas gilva]|uniref:hypothetical protein n=1 Tax=Sphingomonas gilva TaxID=2305907 RepID=UPI001CA4562C
AIARLHEAGQSHTVPRSKAGGISTWQHLYVVLHFVCELRGVHVSANATGVGSRGAMDPGTSLS